MTGRNKPPMTEETYIRQLPYSVIKYMSLLLDIDRQWERFVVRVPKRLQDVGRNPTEMRYSNLQVRLFEDKSRRPDGSPTKTIIDDWGTQNTKVKHLIRILQEAALYEAADYISVNVLQMDKVPRLQQQDGSSTETLPAPTWSDQKAKDISREKVPTENFDGHFQKNIYERAKAMGNETMGSPYNSLMKHGEDEVAYNKLSPCEGKLIYRARSFDSGGTLSSVLKDGNEGGTGVEHEDETYQIRPFHDDTAVKGEKEYSYAYSDGRNYEFAKEIPEGNPAVPSKRREPCETPDDSVPVTEHSNGQELRGSDEPNDLYKVLGKQKLTYDLLKFITDDFNPKQFTEGGRVIGSGGFGDVFLGKFEDGFHVAVKRLKNADDIDKQFETELNSLVKYRHRNIVRLYGFSVDGPGKCLVYEYLCNGSLEDRLMRRNNTSPLTIEIRLSILKGTAEGINFLNKQGMVHRDIKSANVLLDETFDPKVGDFATARTGPRGNTTMQMSTQVVIGTSAYLAPEAIHFDVSTKLDSYSFGIVILEVLTALHPLDHCRENKDLKSHIQEHFINDMLDTTGGKWMDDTVAQLVAIYEKCTKTQKKKRSNVADILPDLLAVM